MDLNAGAKAYGPYAEDRGGTTKWRVTLVGPGGRRASRLYETQEAAEAVARSARRKVGIASVGKMVTLYIDYLRLKGIRPRSISTTEHRLTRLTKSVYDRPITDLTSAVATKLYLGLTQHYAVDTHRNMLGQARSWGKWVVKAGHAKTNPWTDVEGVGERSYGKEEIRIDEARAMWRVVKDKADEGSVAVALALSLGLRSGEIRAIVARDVDADGSVLWVAARRGKTRHAKRQLLVPLPLRAPLKELAKYGGRLFPRSRGWLLKVVKRTARRAGIEGNFTAHGLRGLHATLKVEFEAAQRDLGHKPGSSVTENHYLAPGTVERATARRVWEVLDE